MTEQTSVTPEAIPRATTTPMDTATRLSYERTGLSHERTDLSQERTTLSHERTLLSWVRTATALITFGFTIYKFFDIEERHLLPARTREVFNPRDFAMFMIATGLLALAAAAIQNWQYRRHLRKKRLRVPISLATLVGALISALGLLAMASAVFRW